MAWLQQKLDTLGLAPDLGGVSEAGGPGNGWVQAEASPGLADPSSALAQIETGDTGDGDEALVDGPGDLAASLAKVERMIATARRLGFHEAADNLAHWLEGSGSRRRMEAEPFLHHGFIHQHLVEVVLPIIQDGARARVADGRLSAEQPTAVIHWAQTVSALPMTDLFFALGSFTLQSDVVVHLDAATGTLRIGEWTCSAYDTYDWDAGKSTLIPGFGRVQDDELAALEAAGHGRRFEVETAPFTVDDPALTVPFSARP